MSNWNLYELKPERATFFNPILIESRKGEHGIVVPAGRDTFVLLAEPVAGLVPGEAKGEPKAEKAMYRKALEEGHVFREPYDRELRFLEAWWLDIMFILEDYNLAESFYDQAIPLDARRLPVCPVDEEGLRTALEEAENYEEIVSSIFDL